MVRQTRGLILPVAGGKGGTGKSVLAVNLAAALAGRGFKTLVADLDLGGSNVHTLLGQKNLSAGLGRLLVEKDHQVRDLCHPTPWPNLSYLPGDNQIPHAANPYTAQRQKIIRGLKALDYQAVVCDLGAGTSSLVLDFFLASPRGLLVCTPELTSLINAYAFLRQAIYRALSVVLRDNAYATEVLRDYRASPLGPEGWTMARLVEETAHRAPGQEKRISKVLKWWRPGLIMNLVRGAAEIKGLDQIVDLAQRKLSLTPLCLGALPFDESVVDSVRERLPALHLAPEGLYARVVGQLVDRLAAGEDVPLISLRAEVEGWSLRPRKPDEPAGPPLNQMLAELLPVVDDITRALKAAKKEGQEALAEGLAATLKAHLTRLAALGLEPIPTKGASFDPNLHEAVAVKKAPGAAKGAVLAEVNKGFTYKGRLLKPAQVVVAG